MQGLVDLAQDYSQSYRFEYGASKTVISVVGSSVDMQYYQDVQPWSMHNLPISVRENNDHRTHSEW